MHCIDPLDEDENIRSLDKNTTKETRLQVRVHIYPIDIHALYTLYTHTIYMHYILYCFR